MVYIIKVIINERLINMTLSENQIQFVAESISKCYEDIVNSDEVNSWDEQEIQDIENLMLELASKGKISITVEPVVEIKKVTRTIRCYMTPDNRVIGYNDDKTYEFFTGPYQWSNDLMVNDGFKKEDIIGQDFLELTGRK